MAFLHALIGDKRYFVRPPTSECRPGFLWRLNRAMYGLQDEFRAGRLEIAHVNTLVNPADLMTKHLHRSRLEDLMELVGMMRGGAEQ